MEQRKLITSCHTITSVRTYVLNYKMILCAKEVQKEKKQ
ncbi:unnamed protein product [Musa acuminata subsp. malaccensis]|uniref:(wild Malaysian banana) hypothetical protein n=1 Tax=Musa acuminata subsp. malaccensis TaxID=214687 RepID=A0A804L6R7_MUSAM|nr:unnamed protein product [Musa acuminata subsp. malaccensis]